MAVSPGERIATQLGRLLLRTTRQSLYQKIVEDVDGIDATTYPVLSGLARLGPATATQLAAAIGLDRTVTTRYASKLEAAGLLHRVPDPADARAAQLELSAAGRVAAAATRRNLSSAVDDILATWPTAEAAAFSRSLERFTDRLEDPGQ
jgi:DNA-binding MarR family transcriptional regulator